MGEQAVERLLVIGADAAGMSAAHQAIRTARRLGRPLEVIAVDAGHHTSYSACGIPYVASGEVASIDALVARTPAEHRAAGIDLRLGVRVRHLDLERRAATLSEGDEIGFDQVMVASGARPVTPEWALDGAGALLSGIRHAKTLDDAAAWAAAFSPGERVVIAGGGYIGVEMAEAALRRGLDVALVTRSRVLSSFADETSTRIVAALTEAGVRVFEQSEVRAVDSDAGAVSAVLVDGARLECDHVVLAIGVAPATEFLAHTDLLHGRRAALRPDERGRVAPGLWAAGDCCEVRAASGDWTYAPLGTHATKAGRVAGENLAGGDLRMPGVLGTSITRFAHGDVHLEISRTGVLDRQLGATTWDPFVLTTEGTMASGYMPEAEPIAVRICADRGSRRLLSAEIVGGRGAGKRIDTVAAVLHHQGTVDDLAWMDLAYAPPVATAWEIIQIAARRVAERI